MLRMSFFLDLGNVFESHYLKCLRREYIRVSKMFPSSGIVAAHFSLFTCLPSCTVKKNRSATDERLYGRMYGRMVGRQNDGHTDGTTDRRLGGRADRKTDIPSWALRVI